MPIPLRRLAALLLAMAPLLALADGPYAWPDPGGGWTVRRVVETGGTAAAGTETLTRDQAMVVDGSDGAPAFEVRLRAPADRAPDALNVESDAPLFVVADIHGEYGILVELLRHQGIIDAALRWNFGAGHLVFLGDAFDRGSHQVAVLWLVYQLQGEAEAAGGSVEFLLGNHELLALRGDVRYLHPRYLADADALGVTTYAELFDAESVLGQWLRTRGAILRAGDVLLAHGGISPQVVQRDLSAAALSRAVREVLDGRTDSARPPLHDFAIGSSGPLWYRGYFARGAAAPEARAEEIEALRRHFGVRAILVGHTALDEVSALFAGRVIGVQVYPARDAGNGRAVMGAVRRDRGRWYRAAVNGDRSPLEIAPQPAESGT